MKRIILIFSFMLLLAFCMAGCGRESRAQETERTSQTTEQDTEETIETERPESPAENTGQEQTEYIGAVPEEYFAASGHAGQVIEVTYDSRDYTDASQPAIQKTAYVYLPYGYDDTDLDTRYDILYLMHGWTMTAGDFFDGARSGIVPMLDHMIENGEIPPVIVVCATFDAQNQSQSFSRSVEELSVFHNDLRENLMPYIESRYHTYAGGCTAGGLSGIQSAPGFWRIFPGSSYNVVSIYL